VQVCVCGHCDQVYTILAEGLVGADVGRG
jgi:hypothetical protein